MTVVRTETSLLDRLMLGLACGGLAQAVQMPFFWAADKAPVSADFFVAHALLVVSVHVGLALLLGRWPRLWTAAAFWSAPALAVWPVLHALWGVPGLLLLDLGFVVCSALLAALLRGGAPWVAAAAGAALGGQLARWTLEGGEGVSLVERGLGLGLALAAVTLASRLPAPVRAPRSLPALALGLSALGLAALLAPVRLSGFSPVPVEREIPADAPAPAVLIVLDTLRADHLPTYGYARDTMPALDRFATRHGVVVERALTNAPTSLPTHASYFTGLVPPRHGARYPTVDDPDPPVYANRLRKDVTTLGERLRERGYWSVAITANAGALSPWYGLGRGFDVYRAILDPAFRLKPRSPWRMASRRAEPLEVLSDLAPFEDSDLFGWGVPYRRARIITDDAIVVVDAAGDQPFFLFVNYFDPHGPYDPPRECRDLYPGRRPKLSRPRLKRIRREVTEGARGATPAEYKHMAALYDGELACLDLELARLLERLERHPRWEEMLVIVTSDHGEAFGEHGYVGHGVNLYDELVRVPMILKPGRRGGLPEPGSRLPGPLQPVDVFPTVLEHAGLRAADDGDGRAWGRGRTRARAWIGVKQRHARRLPERFFRDLRSVEEGGWKLIESSRGQRELYRPAEDPAEATDRSGSAPEQLRRLEAALGAAPVGSGGRGGRDSDEALERLRALGYVE